jgi:gamma-glutamyl-gamma-aminobutyrate hydrolase PuuD
MERLLLLGGADIHPWLYGQPRRSYTHCDTDRDKVEWALVRRAMAAQIPIFGICRGHQMITVAFGGTLHQDMADKLGTTHSNSHRIIVQGPLKEHIASRTVNSYHHQCTADVPLGFEIAAVAPDNVIESIYRPGVLGVQWHPEMMVRSDQRWLHLFRWFLEGQLDPAWDG